jgi:hypothetical protein
MEGAAYHSFDRHRLLILNSASFNELTKRRVEAGTTGMAVERGGEIRFKDDGNGGL